jgi:hypothetical protein
MERILTIRSLYFFAINNTGARINPFGLKRGANINQYIHFDLEINPYTVQKTSVVRRKFHWPINNSKKYGKNNNQTTKTFRKMLILFFGLVTNVLVNFQLNHTFIHRNTSYRRIQRKYATKGEKRFAITPIEYPLKGKYLNG